MALLPDEKPNGGSIRITLETSAAAFDPDTGLIMPCYAQLPHACPADSFGGRSPWDLVSAAAQSSNQLADGIDFCSRLRAPRDMW